MEPTLVTVSMVGTLFYSFAHSIACVIGAIAIFLAAYTFQNNLRMKIYNKTLKAYHAYNNKIFELISLLHEDDNFDLNNIKYKTIKQELLFLSGTVSLIVDKDVQLKISQLFINPFINLHKEQKILDNTYETKETYLIKLFDLQNIMKDHLDRIKPFRSY